MVIVMPALDFDGKEIKVGCTVIFPHSKGGKLIKGEVLSISNKQCRIECLTEVIPMRDFRTGDVTLTPEVTSRNHEHVYVV